MNQLTNIQKVAMMKAVSGDSSVIPAGKHSGEFAVRVRFNMSKGEDGSRKPTSNLLSKAVLAKAMVMSGIQADNFIAALKQAAADAMNSGGSVAETVTEEDRRVIEMIERVEREVSERLPEVPTSGKTSVKAVVEMIELPDQCAGVEAIAA